MILNDLISPPIDCATEAVNNPCLHFNNRADGIENEERIENGASRTKWTTFAVKIDSTPHHRFYNHLWN